MSQLIVEWRTYLHYAYRMTKQTNAPVRFLAELKRRKVYRVAVAYLVVIFLTLQIIDLLIPATTLPEWVDSFLLAIAIMGFPIAIIAAWALELTPQGVRWTQPDDLGRDENYRPGPARLIVAVSLMLIIGFFAWWYMIDSKPGEGAIANRTIAVMPFHTLGSDQANAFTEGVHLGVLTRLSDVSDLDVISRTSVKALETSQQTLPEIAAALGARWVLRAEVQEVGSTVQVNARLINAYSDRQVWAKNYRRTLTVDNVFDIQSELALAIIKELHARLTPLEKARVNKRSTTSLKAFGLHAQGRNELDKRDEQGMRSAVEYFEQSIAQDPGFTLAWVGLADALTLLYDYHIDRRDVLLVKAGEAVQHALELDPLSAEAHASRGLLQYAQQDAPNAILALTRSVELKPNYADAQSWLAWVQQVQGDSVMGLESAKRGVAVNPLSGEAISNLTLSYLATGDYEKALAQSLHNQTVLPSWPTAQFYEALALYHLGRFEEVQARLKGVNVDWTDSGAESTLALAYIASGNEVAARELLALMEHAKDPFSTGLVYAALGENEKALAIFEQIERWNTWPPLAMRHFFPNVLGSLAETPQYKTLFEKMRKDWGY